MTDVEYINRPYLYSDVECIAAPQWKFKALLRLDKQPVPLHRVERIPILVTRGKQNWSSGISY